jgi:serine/threonine protein kinase
MKDKLHQDVNVQNDKGLGDVSSRSKKEDHTVFKNAPARNLDNKTRVASRRQLDATRQNPSRNAKNSDMSNADAKRPIEGNIDNRIEDATRLKTREQASRSVNPRPEKQRQIHTGNDNVTRTTSRPEKSTGKQNQRIVLKERFTLEKVIGVGGMGVVYKATDRLKVEARDREPYVAIKVLSEEFKSHPESFIALQRESRKTQRIAHPNVVKVYDFDRDGDTVFMTMEYLEGVPLDQLIKQYSATGLPREEAWSILYGLCSALVHAHAENIVHSDFKPGNIFVTDSGMAKIFDFGIARAVANVDRHTGKMKDRTVFDAGSLGALTPAYASLEMLQGQAPDVRDDVYALGCIAYEMLTGIHPFNRMPADEAFKSKLRPKKIANIKKRQWKAIERALMFRREDRMPSVDEFYHQIQAKSRSISLLLPTLLVILAIAVSTYFIVTHESKPTNDNKIQVDKIEFKIRYDLFTKKISKLIMEKSFTSEWESSLWDEVSGMTALLKGKPDYWLSKSRRKIYELYIDKYQEMIQAKNFTRAGSLLENAYRYTDDADYLDEQKTKLAEMIKDQNEKERAMAIKRQSRKVSLSNKLRKQKADRYIFDLALKNVNQQLECQGKLNMRELGIAINKLRSVNMRRYQSLKNSLVTTLANCITHIGMTQPARAIEDKSYALRIFSDNQLIHAIKILPRDACNKSIAGLGSRGERAVCRDKIRGVGEGPSMVVIPGNARIKTFAIGKYEISVREINEFCKISRSCTLLNDVDNSLPAVNINIHVAQNYVHWLSRLTKQKYRLPTIEEWIYAAKANRHYRDPNRNCALNSRGIEKGGQLVRANTGAQNHWGLVNYLGNAREWVYDKSHNLDAVGGSFLDSMDQCNINTRVRHSGRADSNTGFRVVREVER